MVMVAVSLSKRQPDMESMFGSNITTSKEPVCGNISSRI